MKSCIIENRQNRGSVEMNRALGEIIEGIVTDKNKTATYVQKDGITYELNEENEAALGEVIKGFAYEDKNGNNKLTSILPAATKTSFGWGTVVQSRHDLGVFVDIGLLDKDIVVSMDLLSKETFLWPKKGDSLFITLTQDKEGRLWGVPAEEALFFEEFVPGTKEEHNQDIEGTVFRVKLSGSLFVTPSNKIGFIHPNEREQEPRLGEKVNGRVIGLREDGVLYTSLLKRAHEALEEDAAMILEVLKRSPEHKIALTDKSDPEKIRTTLGISKAQFKRSFGRLMKMGLAKQDKEYTYYISNETETSL